MENDDMHSDYHCPRQASTGMSGNFMAALVGKSSRLSVTPAVLIGVPLYSNAVRITLLVVTSAIMGAEETKRGLQIQRRRLTFLSNLLIMGGKMGFTREGRACGSLPVLLIRIILFSLCHISFGNGDH